MKRSALLAVIFWWLQAPVCLLPVASSHTHIASQATREHHHEAPPAAPASGHHRHRGSDDSGCAEHCASLARALSPAAPQPIALASPWILLPVASLSPGENPRLAAPSEVAREQPPPDLLLQDATLRI